MAGGERATESQLPEIVMPSCQVRFYSSEDTEHEQELQIQMTLCSSQNQSLQLHTSRKVRDKKRGHNKPATTKLL
jgi:hypothetical protein